MRWKAHQGKIDASRLVFIDETWIKTNMAPLRGWGPSGQRLEASAPFGHWKTMTFIAALRCVRVSRDREQGFHPHREQGFQRIVSSDFRRS